MLFINSVLYGDFSVLNENEVNCNFGGNDVDGRSIEYYTRRKKYF